jgi:hypothetical protein
MTKKTPVRNRAPVSVEIDGKIYRAHYVVSGSRTRSSS